MNMTIEELVARRVDLKERIDRLEDEVSRINAEIQERYERGEIHMGNNDAGDYTLQLRVNRRLDEDRFTKRFPVAQYPAYYTAKPSLTAIKGYMAPVELAAFYTEGTPSVIVK